MSKQDDKFKTFPRQNSQVALQAMSSSAQNSPGDCKDCKELSSKLLDYPLQSLQSYAPRLKPVHSLMALIHLLLGLPWGHIPPFFPPLQCSELFFSPLCNWCIEHLKFSLFDNADNIAIDPDSFLYFFISDI